MPKVQPGQSELRKFLTGAIIDPNRKGNTIEQQLVETGDPGYFETRTIEHMIEAKRLRERMPHANGKALATLKEQYALVMTKAATGIAIASCKINKPEPVKVVKKKPVPVPSMEGKADDA